MAVKADLGSNLTEIVIGVVALIANTIKIVEELVVFIRYKASELKVFKIIITVTITKRVRKGIKIISITDLVLLALRLLREDI